MSKNNDENFSNDTNYRNTPKRVRKIKKRKKNKMKEMKLMRKSRDDYELLDNPTEMEQLSLFARDKDKKEYSDSSNSENDGEDHFCLEPKSAMSSSYYFKRTTDFNRSAKTNSKNRKSSIKEDEAKVVGGSLNKTQPKRKVSKTSSSDNSDNFERDEEDSGAYTTSASKHHTSQFSSSENTLIGAQDKHYKISNFNEIIKEEREESSPLPQRVDQRKDSLTADLDILYRCSQNLNLSKISSGVDQVSKLHYENFDSKPNLDE